VKNYLIHFLTWESVNLRKFEEMTKYGKEGRSDGMIVGRVRLENSSSFFLSILNSQKVVGFFSFFKASS